MNSTLTSIRWICASNSLFMNPSLAFAAWNHVKIGWRVSWFQNGAITRDHWWAHRLQQFNVKVCRPGQSKQRQPWRFLSHVRWNLELIRPVKCKHICAIRKWQNRGIVSRPVTVSACSLTMFLFPEESLWHPSASAAWESRAEWQLMPRWRHPWCRWKPRPRAWWSGGGPGSPQDGARWWNNLWSRRASDGSWVWWPQRSYGRWHFWSQHDEANIGGSLVITTCFAFKLCDCPRHLLWLAQSHSNYDLDSHREYWVVFDGYLINFISLTMFLFPEESLWHPSVSAAWESRAEWQLMPRWRHPWCRWRPRPRAWWSRGGPGRPRDGARWCNNLWSRRASDGSWVWWPQRSYGRWHFWSQHDEANIGGSLVMTTCFAFKLCDCPRHLLWLGQSHSNYDLGSHREYWVVFDGCLINIISLTMFLFPEESLWHPSAPAVWESRAEWQLMLRWRHQWCRWKPRPRAWWSRGGPGRPRDGARWCNNLWSRRASDGFWLWWLQRS